MAIEMAKNAKLQLDKSVNGYLHYQ